MELNSFFDLIKSGNESYVALAWQIAQGLKDSGDKYFIKFCKAVNSWLANATKTGNPEELLLNLGNGDLLIYSLDKQKIHKFSKYLSPFVKRIKILDFKCKEFPLGFSAFSEVEELEFKVKINFAFGNQLNGILKLKKLVMRSANRIIIQPEFADDSNYIESIVMEGNFEFPYNCKKLKNLKSLDVNSEYIIGPIGDLPSLKTLIFESIYPIVSDCKFLELFVKIKELENLKIRSSYSLREYEMSEVVYEFLNLKTLSIPKCLTISEKILNLKQLKTVYIHSAKSKYINYLPKIESLEYLICNGLIMRNKMRYDISPENSKLKILDISDFHSFGEG